MAMYRPAPQEEEGDYDWVPWVVGGLALAGGAAAGLGALGGTLAAGAGEAAGTAALTSGGALEGAATAMGGQAAGQATAAALPAAAAAGQTALGAGGAVTAPQVAAMQTAGMLSPAHQAAYTTAAAVPVRSAQISGGMAGLSATAGPAIGMIQQGIQGPPQQAQGPQAIQAQQQPRHQRYVAPQQQQAPQMPPDVLASMAPSEAQALGPGVYDDWMRRRKGGPMSMFTQQAYGGRQV